MSLLERTIKEVKTFNQEKYQEIQKIWDQKMKPIGSLGKLEEISSRYGAITGKTINKIEKSAIVVFFSDNGVIEEGVSGTPIKFTRILADAMVKGTTGVASLAKDSGSDLYIVDIGMLEDPPQGLINKKIRRSSRNFTKGPAMTMEETIQAIEIGIEIGDQLYSQGYDILGTGEVGMANTTTSAALIAALTDIRVEEATGPGSGLDKQGLERKIRVIKEAIRINKIDRNNLLDTLSKLGGFDICGMVGLYLSAGKNSKPIIIDGFISLASLLVATRLNENVKDYAFASHLSLEPGMKKLLDELEIDPPLNMNMRLGEGSACPLALKIIESSLFALEDMGTFADSQVTSQGLLDLRKLND